MLILLIGTRTLNEFAILVTERVLMPQTRQGAVRLDGCRRFRLQANVAQKCLRLLLARAIQTRQPKPPASNPKALHEGS